MKEDLIKQILKIEWDMFQNVSNMGGPASCQQDAETFQIMRSSQAMAWNEAMLESYLKDLTNAQKSGRNLMVEKYAYMMQSTFPDEYAKIVDTLPRIDVKKRFLVEHITAMMVQWGKELKEKYPRVMGEGRPLCSEEDTPYATSMETYCRGEFATYSAETLQLCYDYYLKCKSEGQNHYETIINNTAKQYEYDSIEQAEKG